MYELLVTNKNIYINNIPIINFLSFFNNLQIEIQKDVKIYTITNVVFCNISGILSIYISNNNVENVIFTTYNTINIYDIPNTTETFNNIIKTFKYTLSNKYRKIDDMNYFNKKFKISITYNENNCSVLISKRSTI